MTMGRASLAQRTWGRKRRADTILHTSSIPHVVCTADMSWQGTQSWPGLVEAAGGRV